MSEGRVITVVAATLGIVLFGSIACAVSAASTPATETVVLFRHGEKPAQGFGQLSCQGLNRALALPPVLAAKFGRPDFLFAPDPAQQRDDGGALYGYIRPLATIEPTAIQLVLPVNIQFAVDRIDQLEAELLAPRYQHALIFVVWEHKQLTQLVRHLLAATGGNPAVVPAWRDKDYDGIFVVRITRDESKVSAAFTQDSEGLNRQSTVCPVPR